MPKKDVAGKRARKSERIVPAPKAGGARRESVRMASGAKAPPPAKAAAPVVKEKGRTGSGASARLRPGAPGRPEVRRESPLTKAQLEDVRDALVLKLADLKRNIDRGVQGARDRDLAHIQDTSDMAADTAEGDLVLRIAENEAVAVVEVERAIEKIDNGTYGICESCNHPIGIQRLQFLPFATHCVHCTRQREVSRSRENGGEEEWEALDETEADE